MATFKTVVRNKRTDGTYSVYIRVTHNRKISYIKTGKSLESGKVRGGEIRDNDVLGECAIRIKKYRELLNLQDIEKWDIGDVISFLKSENKNIRFKEYATIFLTKLSKENRTGSLRNYNTALNSFYDYFGENISFQDVTSNKIKRWIDSLSATARAKQMYPEAIKTIFNQGCDHYNEYEKGLIKIPNRPFKAVEIPKADTPNKRAISPYTIMKIFNHTPLTNRGELAQDVVKLVFFLVGINTVDLYNLKTSDVKRNRICYNRSKTKGKRDDKAYIEIPIPHQVRSIIEKYADDTYLFSFHSRYSDAREFNRGVNIGLKSVCEELGIEKVDTYTFRHSWATIARTNCDYSYGDVAFCLNHESAHKMTMKYIKVDYSKIGEINNSVIEFTTRKRRRFKNITILKTIVKAKNSQKK